MGSDTKNVIGKLFNTILQIFQQAQETSNDNGSEFIPESVELLYYYFQETNIRRAESYIRKIKKGWYRSFITQRDWEEFAQNNTLTALNVLFVSYNSDCYYFAVKNSPELYSLGWLRSKKEAMINGDNDFQNALDDALNYQTIETHPERISKIKSYINKYNWEGIEFLGDQKARKILNEIIRQLLLIYYLYQKT